MKKLIVLFVFISGFIFCSAGNYVSKDGYLWEKTKIKSACDISCDSSYINMALLSPGKPVAISKSIRLIKLKVPFKRIDIETTNYIYFDKDANKIRTFFATSTHEKNSILAFFWLLPLFLVALSKLASSIKIKMHKFVDKVIIIISTFILFFASLLIMVLAIDGGLLFSYKSYSTIFGLLAVMILFTRKGNDNEIMSNRGLILYSVCIISSLVFILL